MALAQGQGFKLTKERLVLGGLLFLVLVIWWLNFVVFDENLKVSFVDVGQGDAILVESPGGRRILIDAGPGPYFSGTGVLSFLNYEGVKVIDLLVLTHPDGDHIGGMPEILDNFKVGMVLDSGLVSEFADYRRCLRVIRRKEIPYREARWGQVINLGFGIRGWVIHPGNRFLLGTKDDENNNSVVIKLTYGKVSFLFLADVGLEAEREIIRRVDDLRSDVLKVGHHGSELSTGEELLSAVRPGVAILLVGKNNPFGHPSPEVVNRLKRRGIKIYKTDTQGTITVVTDGKSLEVKCFGKI